MIHEDVFCSDQEEDANTSILPVPLSVDQVLVTRSSPAASETLESEATGRIRFTDPETTVNDPEKVFPVDVAITVEPVRVVLVYGISSEKRYEPD